MKTNSIIFLIFIILIIIFLIYCYFFKINNENENIQIFEKEEDTRKFKSIGEELSCKVFEEYLGYKVHTNIRPNFLKNPKTNKNLELDIFDERSNIAIEYNGYQHYIYPNSYHTSKKEFDEQIYRDKIKLELTSLNNIHLIHIPYYVDTCRLVNGEYKKISNITKDYRKQKLKEYLYPLLQAIKGY